MEEVPVDFDNFRLSVLLKAVSISPSATGTVTLGPNSPPPRVLPPQSRSENNQNATNISPSKPSKCPTSKPKPFSFSIEKILYENEHQRREQVLKAVNQRKKEMDAFEERLQLEKKHMRLELAVKREREMAAEMAKQEAEEKRLAQQEELKRRHEAQLQAQRLQERQEKLKRETDEHRRLKEHEECLERIVSCRASFTDKYAEVGRLATSMIRNKNLIGQVVGPFMSKLKDLSLRIDGIIEGGKTGLRLTRNQVNDAENVLREADEVFSACKDQLNGIKEQEMLAQTIAASAEHKAGQETAVPDGTDGGQLERTTQVNCQERVEVSPPETGQHTNCSDDSSVDVKGIQVYLNSRSLLERYREAFRDLDEGGPNWGYGRDCKKKLNILVKSISHSHLREIVRKFEKNFEGKAPAELAFAKNCIAETIVDEVKDFAEQKFKRIYALAAVVVSLWHQHPDFGDLVLSYLHIQCPYIIPVVMPRFQGQSDEDFYGSRGYTYSNGVREDEQAFLKRMIKFMRFYAAIIITKLPRDASSQHPHGLDHAWRWLATILNAQPRHDAIEIYPRLLTVFLESTGHSMLRCYPTQFRKILRVITGDYCLLLARRAGEPHVDADVLQLQITAIKLLKCFVDDAIAKDSIVPPEGQLTGNFW